MKKFFTLLSALCISAIAVMAQEEPVYFNTDGLRYIVTDTQAATAALTYVDEGYKGDLVIPSTAVNPDDSKNYTITSLAQEALYRSNCSSVTLPATVTALAEDAFFNASIGRFVVGDDNPAFCVVDDILYSKDMTRLVSFPNQKDYSGYTLPESVTEIGAFAFCSVWLTEFTVPARITTIGRGAFMATKLKTFTVPATVSSLGGALLQNCQSLKSVTLEEGITAVPDHFLTSCWMLEEVNLPSTLTQIGDYAFSRTFVYSYGNLITSFTVPDNVTLIGMGAFEGNHALKSFTIGEKVETLSYYAFTMCTNLKELTCKAPLPPFCRSIDFSASTPAEVFYDVPADCVLYVPETSLPDYRAKWGEKFSDIRGVVGLGHLDEAFTDASGMKIAISGFTLTVETEQPVEIFSADGKKVASAAAGVSSHSLSSGIYLIRSGNATRKVAL